MSAIFPAEHIWALVSGLPKGGRESRLLAMFQTFVDDSGNEPQSRFFVLGGLIASTTQWAAFSDQWKAVLDAPPSIAYFKSNEAYGLKGEFAEAKGWTAQSALKKMAALEKVIQNSIPERVSVAVSHDQYTKYLDGIPIRNRFTLLNNPYFMLFYEIILVSLVMQTVKPIPAPCDFIFDEHGKIGDVAAAWWRGFKVALKNTTDVQYDPYLGSPPILRNDKCFVALQAADFYAGQIHRHLQYSDTTIPSREVSLGWTPRGEFICHRHLTEEHLQGMRETFLTAAKAIEEASGQLPWVVLS